MLHRIGAKAVKSFAVFHAPLPEEPLSWTEAGRRKRCSSFGRCIVPTMLAKRTWRGVLMCVCGVSFVIILELEFYSHGQGRLASFQSESHLMLAGGQQNANSK